MPELASDAKLAAHEDVLRERYPDKFELVDDAEGKVDADASPEGTVDEEEAQTEGQTGESESEQDGDEVSGDTISLKEFTKAAGWKLEEFYNGVTVPVNGDDVPLSRVLDDFKELSTANSALSQERDELQEKLNQSVTSVPSNGQMSPELLEALILNREAEGYQQMLLTTDWSQLDPQSANSQRLDLQQAIQVRQSQAQAKAHEHQTKMHEHMRKARGEVEKQIRQKIPAWSDRKIRAQEEQRARDTAVRFGYTAEEYDSWVDPRAVHVMHELSKLQEEKALVKKGVKRVRQVRKGSTLGEGSRDTGGDKVTPEEAARRIRDAKTREARSATRMKVDLGPLR